MNDINNKKNVSSNTKLSIEAQMLRKHLDSINSGLSFFGIQAQIDDNDPNKLNFYQNNELIYQRDYSEDYYEYNVLIDQYINTEFNDSCGNRIKFYLSLYGLGLYSRDYEYNFYLTSPNTQESDKNNWDYNIQIEVENGRFNNPSNLRIINNSNDQYTRKYLDIGDRKLTLTLNKKNSQGENKKETAWRTFACDFSRNTFYMEESYKQNDTDIHRSLNGDECEFECDHNDLYLDIESPEQFEAIALNIARHPRNAETLEYILDSFEQDLFGVRDYLRNNSIPYNGIVNGEYISDPYIDNMIQSTIIEKCNLNKDYKKLAKKNEK